MVAVIYLNAHGKTQTEDLETLRIASNLKSNALNLCPYVLDQPAAPHLVAAQQGLALETRVLINAFKRIQNKADFVVVDGVGGFLVPLNDKED